MTTLVLGVAAKHVWTPTGGTAFTLNDMGAWPRYELIPPIRGLRTLPDVTDNSEANTEALGESAYLSIASGKTITYSGNVYGRTWPETEQAASDLLAAFGPDLTTGALKTGRMVITPDSGLSTHMETFTGRCRLCDVSESKPTSPTSQPSPYFADFTLDIRLQDPRLWDWDGATATNPHW